MFTALIFDFDGLILDTETAEIRTWQRIYAECGYAFPEGEFIKTVGGYGISNFDAALYLDSLTNGSLNAEVMRTRFRSESGDEIRRSPILPGVTNIISEAKCRQMKLAVASSSPHSWVDTHLTRLGLFGQFDKVICGDDVALGRTKPKPDLFLKALEQLHVEAREAMVFEDSPNGVEAANAAGIAVVLAPNPTTSLLPFKGEYLKLKTLADLSLTDMLLHYETRKKRV
ncbi:MAG TPA: HAD family phosphatase [Anaerolineales bacterium]|nr:HAD family phosphatase [Anaerolineales bacterium]